MSFYISVTRYRYFMSDLFTGEWLEVSEKCFDDCVVRFRSCYEMHYENHSQVFYNLDSGTPEFKRVSVGEVFHEI